MKCLTILFLLFSNILQAQDPDHEPKKEFDVGIGIGIDYGGIGARATFKPISHLGLFAAAGYNFNSIGFNAGGQWHFPQKRNDFYITAMYGYNAVIAVSGDIEDKGTYYGVSAGLGYELHSRRRPNFWNFEILVPFRNSNFKDDVDALKYLGADLMEPLPIAISIGYHFKIL
ncbi:MAG TPA: hypothetical protein VF144_14240 [Chitinophagaceae bacterium]